jgi:hypothetical protein
LRSDRPGKARAQPLERRETDGSHQPDKLGGGFFGARAARRYAELFVLFVLCVVAS